MTCFPTLNRQAALGNQRVRKYYPRKAKDSWLEDKVYGIYEPEGRCNKTLSLHAARDM